MDRADALSVSRILLAASVWLAPRKRPFLLAVAAAAGVTDLLDGWVARRTPGHRRDVGVWLDPLCDKIFVASILGAINYSEKPPRRIPLLIATRELIQLPALAAYVATPRSWHPSRPLDVQAAAAGKLATAVQYLAMGSVLFRTRWTLPLAILAGVTGIGAATFYVRRALPSASGPGTSRPPIRPSSAGSYADEPSRYIA